MSNTAKANVGSVSWDHPIDPTKLDFLKHHFYIGPTEIECEVPALKGSCRVTFSVLPEDAE
jgi:hypothetical protein